VSPWHDFKEFQQHIGRIEKKRREPGVFLDKRHQLTLSFFSHIGCPTSASYHYDIPPEKDEGLEARWKTID